MPFVLPVLGKCWDNEVALIGDNSNTNVAFARRVGPILVRCFGNRYNLNMHDVIALSETSIDRARELMSKLSYQILSVGLLQTRFLNRKLDNETPWSSTYEIPKCYIGISDVLQLLEMPDADDMLLECNAAARVVSTCQQPKQINSITKRQ